MELANLPQVVSAHVGDLHDGTQMKVMFENGFGASVVRHSFSYGGPSGLYELAVLDSDGDLTYDTSITSDVIGHQTEEEIREILVRISQL